MPPTLEIEACAQVPLRPALFLIAEKGWVLLVAVGEFKLHRKPILCWIHYLSYFQQMRGHFAKDNL